MGTFSKRAVLFGGTPEYCTAGNVNDFANGVDFSGGGWYRLTIGGTDMALMSKRFSGTTGYELRKRSNGRIALILEGSDTTRMFVETTATFDDGAYRHIAFTWEGSVSDAASNATIYVDGAAEALEPPVVDTLAATISNAADFQVSGVGGSTRVLVGFCDDPFLYGDLLTAGEITTIYGGGDPPDLRLGGMPDNLLGYWLMGDGDTFSTITDHGSGANDFTMFSMEAGDINWSPAGGVGMCEKPLPAGGAVYSLSRNRSIGNNLCFHSLGCPTVVDPDVTPPVIGAFSPALGGTIATLQPITFNVTDDSGAFRRILIHARFADGLEEVVHNGNDFRGLYGNGNSARTIVAGGFNFSILRAGGWPQGGPVDINAFAIDEAGNEAA